MYCWILWRIIRYSIPKNEETTETVFLSLITVTNLENTQSSKMLRGVSAFFNIFMTIFVFYSIYQKRLYDNSEHLFTDTWYLDMAVTITSSAILISFLLDLSGGFCCKLEPIFCFFVRKSRQIEGRSSLLILNVNKVSRIFFIIFT